MLRRIVKETRLESSKIGVSSTIATYEYLAPETIKTAKFSKESDIYGLGLLMLETLFERSPGLEISLKLKTEIEKTKGGKQLNDIGSKLIDIVVQCLSIDKNNRPSAELVAEELNLTVNVFSKLSSLK